MKKRFKKLRSCHGMTLIEVLIATAIVAMISAIVAVSIPTVQRAYENTVIAANAEVLLSTSINRLRNELGTARKVTTDPANSDVLNFYNENLNSEARIFKAGTSLAGVNTSKYTEGMILYQRYTNGGTEAGYQQIDPLLPGDAFTKDMYVTYDSVDYANGIVTFHNMRVVTLAHPKAIAEEESVSINTGG